VNINPRVVEGPHVRLEPLTLSHADAFYEAGREWSLAREAVKSGIESALREQALGSALPFATVDKHSTQVVEAKFLMLEHAFDRLGCTRVQFMADAEWLWKGYAFAGSKRT
jgi:hypothetical protein